jgi:hypothetical protein
MIKFQIETVKEDTCSKGETSLMNEPPTTRPKTSQGKMKRPYSSFRKESAGNNNLLSIGYTESNEKFNNFWSEGKEYFIF